MKASDATFQRGTTLHSECECCEHAALRITELEAALRQIAKMKPTPIVEGFMTGPAAMLNACQRIAREALK